MKTGFKSVALITFLTTGLVFTGTIGLFAHVGAKGIVKERMDAMLGMGKIVKSLSAMMRGDSEYDAKLVKEGAAIIKSHAGEAMTKQFPEDVKSEHSEARSEIWKNWEEFKDLASQLEVLAGALEKAADNGLMKNAQHGTGMMGSKSGSMMGNPAMMGQGGKMPDAEILASMPADGVFNMLAQTCSSCHTKFRLEKKK